MPRAIQALSGSTWRFGDVGRQLVAPSVRDDRADVSAWLPATVPGDTRADLMANGRLPASTAPGALRESAWVDERDWWYTLPLAQVEPGQTEVLEADGIDYLSSIWLDGERLAVHEGMFGRQTVILPPRIHQPGPRELGVRIWGSGALRKGKDGLLRRAVRAFLRRAGLGTEYFPDRLNVTKAQFGFGWDFAPRALTCGIWDDIRIVRARGAYIEDVFAIAEPLDAEADPAPVRWRVTLTVRRFDTGQSLRAEVELSELDGETPFFRSEPLPLLSPDPQILVFEAPPMRRWWPWDQGEPYRYRLTVRLSDARGLCDEKEITVGVRTVARERFSTGQPWRFTVNGRHVFLRGANWVPADILPGTLRPDDYAKLVGMAADAGINYLRVWGGGLREKAAFYDECDRRGILVSQEFPLACTFLDHYPRDAEYLALLEREATGIARSLRNHPSLLAWCGGNEINPQRERLQLRTIGQVLQREDSTRLWIPASPSEGDVHNWDVWHGFAPWQALDAQLLPFMSEFGLQAIPMDGPEADMPERIGDPRWAERKLQADKLGHYLGPWRVDELWRVSLMSQRVQAAALQTGIEGCRLRREGSGHPRPCGGVAFWQFNEPWPAVTWSVIERSGKPKLAYEMLKSSYAPLLVAALFVRKNYQPGEFFEAAVWLVNDAPDAKRIDSVLIEMDFDVRIEKPDRSARPVRFESRKMFEVAAASAIQIDSFTVKLDEPPTALRITCEAGGNIIAANSYDLAVYFPPPQPFASRVLRRAADLLLGSG